MNIDDKKDIEREIRLAKKELKEGKPEAKTAHLAAKERRKPEESTPTRGPMLAFIPGAKTWLIIDALWLIIILAVYFYYSNPYNIIVALTAIFAAIAYHYYAYETVGLKERAISTFQQRPLDVYESGPVLVLRPFYDIPLNLRYPTGIQELELETAGIVTAAGEYTDKIYSGDEEIAGEKRSYKSTINTTDLSVYFTYPANKNELIQTAKNAPPPNNLEAWKNLLEEAFNDILRQYGGHRVWKDLMQNRVDFSNGVHAQALEHAKIQKVIEKTKIRLTGIAIKHSKIPDDLKNQITAEEIARYKGIAAGTVEKETRYGIAEGEKKIAQALNEVLKEYEDDGRFIEAMLTIQRTAEKGKATYIALPEQLYGALGTAISGTSGKTPAQQLGVPENAIRQIIATEVTRIFREEGRTLFKEFLKEGGKT